jgi:hypothetical protein
MHRDAPAIIQVDGDRFVKRRNIVAASILGLIAVSVWSVYTYRSSWISWTGFALNTSRSANNARGSLVSERHRGEPPPKLTTTTGDSESLEQIAPGAWASYNRTLTSQRYSPLIELNTNNVRELQVLCTYDTHLRENFQSSPSSSTVLSFLRRRSTPSRLTHPTAKRSGTRMRTIDRSHRCVLIARRLIGTAVCFAAHWMGESWHTMPRPAVVYGQPPSPIP